MIMKERYFLQLCVVVCLILPAGFGFFFTITGVKEGVKLAMYIFINFAGKGQY